MRRRARTHVPRTVPAGQLRRTLEAIRRLRTNFVFGTVLVLFLVLLGRLAKLQIVDHDTYVAMAEKRHNARYKFAAQRGRILDRFGRVLAQSRPLRRVAVDPDPGVIGDPESFSVVAARLLENNPPAFHIRKLIEREQQRGRDGKKLRRYVVLRKRIEDPLLIDRLDIIRAMNPRQQRRERIWGLIVESGEVREYPNDRHAYHVLGTVPREGGARVGIEGHFDRYLSGSTHAVNVQRDGRRRLMAIGGAALGNAHRGGDVQLTLDIVVQHYLEDALDEVVARHAPKELCGIVIDPHSGEILAWANRPNRNGNLGGADGAAAFSGEMDYLTRGFYEVGSVFKPITVAWALEQGVVTATDPIPMPLARKFPGDANRINDTHFVGTGPVSLLIEESSNTGAAELGRRLGSKGMQALWAHLDLCARPKMEFPHLKSGYLGSSYRKQKQWPPWAVHRMAFGQAFTLTPLQLATLYCGLARDDARIVKPSILRRRTPRDPRGPALCAPRHLDVVRQGMRQVVTQGTAEKHVAGSVYPIAGKTGTAQQLPHFNICTFAGFAPADRPQLVCLVLAKLPVAAKASGGEVAGPAVRAVLDQTLAYYRVPTRAAERAKTVRAKSPRTSSTRGPAGVAFSPVTTPGGGGRR